MITHARTPFNVSSARLEATAEFSIDQIAQFVSAQRLCAFDLRMEWQKPHRVEARLRTVSTWQWDTTDIAAKESATTTVPAGLWVRHDTALAHVSKWCCLVYATDIRGGRRAQPGERDCCGRRTILCSPNGLQVLETGKPGVGVIKTREL